jgi:putative ABC transport system substrate-binding protein
MTKMRLLVLALLLGFAALPARADEPVQVMNRVGAWFKIFDAALDHWSVAVPEGTDQRIVMTRKNPVAGPLKRVLVVFPRKSSAYDVAMTQILADFAAKPMNVVFTAAHYANDVARGDAVAAEIERERYDLVYAMGSESIAFLHARHPNISVPVVSVCAKDPVQLGQMQDYERGSGSNFAFTSLNLLVEVQLAYLKELRPGLKNVAVLVDAKNISAVETQSRPIIAAARANGIEAFEIAVQDPTKAAAELAQLLPPAIDAMKRTDATLDHSLIWITGSTSVFAEIATINRHADRAPVLSVVPEVVQEGSDSAVLSIGVSFESNAQLAAKYGADILAGKSRPGEMKVGIVSPPDIAVNFKRAADISLKIPFRFLEAATFVYDRTGKPVRLRGQDVGGGS